MSDQAILTELHAISSCEAVSLDGRCIFLTFHNKNELFGSSIRHHANKRHIAHLIGQLPHLQYLNLRKARLGFAPKVISRDLMWLDLSCNDLTEFPKWITWQSRLQELNLGANHLQAVPDLEHLPLTTLKLYKNQLTILPTVPKKLQHLNVFMNRFGCVPKRIEELSELECLSVGGPTIQAAPSFARLTKLRWLTVACTQLNKLPPGIETMRELELLLAPKNRLNSLPDVTGWPKLQTWSFYGNPVSDAGNRGLVSK